MLNWNEEEIWNILQGWKNDWNVEKKSLQFVSNHTEILHKLNCGRLFHIYSIHFLSLFNLSAEEICNVLQGWKNHWNVEGKKNGIFPNIQQSSTNGNVQENFISEKFLKFVQLKCGRDLQYPTGVEELLKCGRKRRAWTFFQTVLKSSTNWNVENNFISE